MAAAAAPLERYQVLIDIRDAVGRLTPEDLHELAAALLDHGATFLRKTAVLCPRERFDNARFFSLLAASHGFQPDPRLPRLRGRHGVADGGRRRLNRGPARILRRDGPTRRRTALGLAARRRAAGTTTCCWPPPACWCSGRWPA